MPRLLKVLSLNNAIHAVLKCVVLVTFLGVFGVDTFGQCNGLNVSLGQNILACNGTNITLTANITGGPTGLTPIYTWEFNPNGGGGTNTIQGANGSSYTIQNLTGNLDGTYTVTVTYAGSSCTDFDNIDIDQPNGGNGNFDVDAGNDFTICQGAQASLSSALENTPNGVGPYSYSWLSIPGGYTSNQADPTFTNLPTGTYNFSVSATATDNGNTYLGCDIVQITVNNLNLNAGNDQVICQGNNITISPTISNNPTTPAVTYSWVSSPAGYTSTAGNPTFQNIPAGTYTFTGTATVDGCTDTDQIQVIVNPNPTAPTFTIPATGCPGVSIPISGFTPVSGLNYTWNDTPSSGPNVNGGSTSNPTLTFTTGGNFSYTVTATNPITGCSTTSIADQINITTLAINPPDINYVGTLNYLAGQSYNGVFTYDVCDATGVVEFLISNNTDGNNSNTNYSYTWANGTPISPFNSAQQTPNLGNNYFTITGNYNGCTLSQTFNIYVGSNPVVSVAVGNSLNVCDGGSVSALITPGAISPGTTYNLYFSDNPGVIVQTLTDISVPTYANPYTFNSGSCGYSVQGNNCIPNFPNVFYAYVVATNACEVSCGPSTPITVLSEPEAGFNISQTTTCVNTNVTLSTTAVPGNQFQGNAVSGFTCTNTINSQWSISPNTGYTVVTGSLGSTSPNWQNWNGTNNVTLSFNTPGVYSITQKIQSNAGCGLRDTTRTICVIAPPTCAFTVSPTSSCTPLVTTVTNNTTGPSCGNTPLALAYNWTVTNPAGGTSSVATATAINPTITLNNNTVAPNLAALNFPITLVVNPLIPGTTTPVPNCSSTCNQIVTVYPQPVITAQPVSPADVCVGGTFNAITVAINYLGVTGLGMPTYQWYSNVNASNSGGTIIPGATSSSYTPPGNTVGTIHYYCVITFPSNSFCGTLTTVAVPAIVVPDPVASATPTTQTICVGGSIANAFGGIIAPGTGTGTASYQWNTVTGGISTAISGANSSSYSPPIFTAPGTFDYSVTINTSGSGCTANTSAPISVVVIPDPTVTTQPTGNTYCQNTPSGNITILSVSATGGSGTFSYQWFVNTTNSNTGGIAIPSATSASFLPPSGVVGTFYYYCVISQTVTNCSVASSPAEIIIVISPTFTTQPLNTQTLCNGGVTASLSVLTAGGSGNISYQWYSNTTNSNSGGTLITGATASSFTPSNTNASLPNTTYYYCVVSYSSGGCSSIYSSTGAVTILPDPVINTQPTSAQTFCEGGSSAPLIVALQTNTGIGAFTYQWYSNTTSSIVGGTTIPGANADTYTPHVFTTAGTFYYYCIVTDAGNGCGAVTSQVATIIVVVDPTITVQPLPTQTLCQNATAATLSVNGSGGTGTFLYQWFSNSANNTTGGTLIPGATANTYTPSTSVVGTTFYYCVISTVASDCSVNSSVSEVIVNPAPAFTTQPTAANVCVGGTTNQMCVTYSNGTGTPSYQWYSSATNTNSLGTAITGATTSCYTPSAAVAGTTYYYAIISLSGGGCSSITSSTGLVVITPDPVLTTQPTSTQTFCVGGSSAPLIVSLQTNTGIGAFTYQWYSNTTSSIVGGTAIAGANAATYTPPVFTTAGTFYYYCIVTDAGNGCGTVTSQVATIIVVVDPTITVQPLPTQTLCQNATPTALTVTASGGTGTLLYQWFSNSIDNTTGGTLIPGATTSTYSPPTAIVGTIYYYCTVTTADSGCSVTSTTGTVVVNPAPAFTTQPTATNVCVDGTTNQMCVTYSNGTGTPSYQWYSSATNITSGGTAITGATTSCYTPSAAVAGTTYYYAIISLAGGGCSSITSNTGEVIINSNTSLSSQPTPLQNICIGGSIPTPISVSYSGGVGTPTYQWFESPSNVAIVGATSSSFTPPVFTTAGTNDYYVVLSLTGAGCGSQTSNIASINVVADPTTTISLGTSYCQNAGNVTSLSVVVSGGQGTNSYQWYSNATNSNTGGTLVTGANAISYLPPVANTGTTYYYCEIIQSAANCSANSPTAQITVTPAPIFTTQPAVTQSVCVGGATTLLNVAYSNGTGTATYQWYSNTTNSYAGGAAIAGQTSASYTPPSVSSNTLYYYCIVSFSAAGGCSMINSNIAEVVVLPDPTISTQPLTTQTICVGGTIPSSMNVAYTGGVGTPTYQWFSAPSTSIVGETNNTFTPSIFNTPGSFNYYATINLSGSGCDALTSANATVIVVADPTVTAPIGSTYCQNAGNVTSLSVVVSDGQGTISYQWYSNTTGDNTTGTPIAGATAISYTPPVTSTGITYYYCVITQSGANCSVNSPAAQITVTPAPNFTTQPTNTQSVCVGGSPTQLSVAYSNGTGTASYQWYASITNTYADGTAIPGQTSSTFTPPTITSNTIYYYCIISFSASGGCSMINSNIAEVIVLPDPTISTQPLTTQTICVGGTIPAALNVAYTGGVGTPTYQWFSAPSTSLFGETNSSFTPPVFNSTGIFNYYATINLSGSGCDALTSANSTVTIIADPLVTVQPLTTQSVCQNTATTQLSVSITGGTGIASYQWFSNTANSNLGGTLISGATLNTYTPPSIDVGTQYYYCVITQSGTNCGVTSNPACVIVNLAPVFSTQPLGTQQLCLNAATSALQVIYSNGTGIASYQWYSNTINSTLGGTTINSATNNIYTPPSNIDGTFYYYCVVSFNNGGGCPSITSNVSQVIIHPFPIVNITGGQTICLLESSDINFAFTPSSGLYDITYTANGLSVTIDNYNGANPIYTVTPSQTTTYVITNIAYDQVPQCAIQPNTSIAVIVNPLPALNHSSYTFCSDVTTTSLQYIPDANTYTYNWLPNTSANYSGQNNGPNAISVTLPDPIGNAPTNYYYVSNLTNSATGCQALDSILVTINPNPVGSFTLPSTGCVDSPIALSNGNASIGTYEWTIDGILYSSLPNPIPPVFSTLGVHTLGMVAINSYGCTDTLSSVIQIYDLPVSNFTTDLTNGCAPLPVSFTNLSTGQYVTSYDWTFAPDTVSWSNQYTSATLINPPSVTYLQGDVTTVYTVSLAVTNACGTISSQQNITVLPTPVAEFTLATHTICSGSSLVLNNISVGEPLTYYWTYGNTISYNPNLTSMFFPSDSLTQVYPISLTLTNACGTDTYNDSITVLPDNIQGGFTTSLDAGCSPLTVTLTNTTFDTNLSATWYLDDPANTVIANQNTVQFTYLAVNNISQNYNPYLVVTDGCANDTIYSNISVFANPIPNISASQINICAGSSIDFSGNITGGGIGFDYAWNFGGLGTSNTQNSTFTFANGTAQGLNIPVNLMVSSPTNTGSNCSNSVSTTIHVYSNPDLSALSYNTTDGCSLLNTQVANLPANLNTINWGDGATNNSSSHTYANNTGAILTYNLNVTSSITYPTLPNLVCTSTSTEPITVHPSPLPAIASSAANSCEGQLINFSASTLNNQNSGVSYSWNIGNLTNDNASNTSFSFNTGSVTGISYPIELTASQTTLGVTCSEIATTTIVVYDTPDLTPLTFNTNSGCSDLDVTLSNLPTATNQVNWGDGNINFVNAHTYINHGAGLLSFPVVVSSTSTYSTIPQLSCVATSNQIVDVYPTPLPQIFASAINVCEADDIDFIASTANNQNTGITYLWDFGALGTSSSANTTMTFDVGNATGLQTQVVLTAFQNTSGTICSAAVNDNVYVYDTPDLTTALYSDVNNCSPLLVSISNLPTSTYTYNWGDGIITSNPNHLYLNQGTTPLNYNISINATSFYQILPQLSCSSVANQIVQVNPQPFAAFTLSPPQSCLYTPVNTTLQNTSLNAIAPYVWNYDGISHTTNSLNYIATFDTPGAHPVELIVSNQFGCTDSVSQDFIIYELPTVTLNTVADDLCIGATAEFEIDGTGISTSTWDFGDGTILNLLNPSSLAHYYTQPGVYSITAIVTNVFGCTDTVTFQNEVIVHPSPTASFTTSTITADIVYPYFEFYNYSVGAINYYWNFGDSNWSNDINPNHTYNTEGDYLVELTVSNEYNCFDIATQVVHVEGIVVYVPNAFTPLDYNGVNDVFKPSFSSIEGIEFYEFRIYDRWGVKLFQTNDIEEAWIGNSKENEPGDDNYYAQNDIYTYQVIYRKKARANDPQPDRIITGHVTIIR